MGDDWFKLLLLALGWFLGLMTKELSERITTFFRGPKLRLEFGDGQDCVTLTPEQYQVNLGPNVASTKPGQRVVFFARLRVTNTKPRIATKCHAWLVKVEEMGDDGEFRPTPFSDSIPLIWSYNAESETADIAQGVNRYCDLLRIQDDAPGFEPQLRSHKGDVLRPLQYKPLFGRNGVFRFTVLVSAQDVRPESIRITVRRVDQQWPPTASVAA